MHEMWWLKNNSQVLFTPTDNRPANILTKALGTTEILNCRKLLHLCIPRHSSCNRSNRNTHLAPLLASPHKNWLLTHSMVWSLASFVQSVLWELALWSMGGGGFSAYNDPLN